MTYSSASINVKVQQNQDAGRGKRNLGHLQCGRDCAMHSGAGSSYHSGSNRFFECSGLASLLVCANKGSHSYSTSNNNFVMSYPYILVLTINSLLYYGSLFYVINTLREWLFTSPSLIITIEFLLTIKMYKQSQFSLLQLLITVNILQTQHNFKI